MTVFMDDLFSSTRNTKTQEDLPESLLKQIESYNARVSGLQTTNGSVLDIHAPFSGNLPVCVCVFFFGAMDCT